ncbi:MAG TPA: biopolymer transporter ExbD [Gemmatimonadaceae bacterium]|jgi:biopolymer transport protein ExbD
MGRRRGRHRLELNADVNVVSLIDVMLLLLIIFMITAPMMQGGVDIALPKSESRPLDSKDGLSISVTRAGQITVDGQHYTMGEFRVVFRGLAANRTRNGVYLRADKSVDYGTVVQLMAIMNASGVTNIGLITEPEDIH